MLTGFNGRAKRLIGTLPSDSQEQRGPFELEAIAQRTTSAIGDLCEAIAGESTLVLFVDDAHCLDQFSTSVLSALVSWRQKARLLVLVTTREPRPLLKVFRYAERVHHLPLQPLAVEATNAIINDVLSPLAPTTPEVRAHLVETANGNPLFALTLASHYRETGETSGVQSTLAESLARRLDPLPNTALSVLTTCIALGKHCTTDRLLRALEVAPIVLLTPLLNWRI